MTAVTRGSVRTYAIRNAGSLLLLLLPAFGHAAICQTVGEDGEVAYTNVEGSSCPQGNTLSPYRGRVVQSESAQQVAPELVGRTVTRYRGLRMVDPPAGGVIRDNAGNFDIGFALEPSLRNDHFIVVAVDGRTFRGRFGDSSVGVTGLEQGEHRVLVSVSDSHGATVYTAEPMAFSLLRATRQKAIKVHAIAPRGSNYLIQGSLGGGPMTVGASVTIRFADSGTEYRGTVAADKTWSVAVGSEPANHAEFTVTATTPGNARFERVQRIHPGLLRPGVEPSATQGYAPAASGIPATPGQTNPAFAQHYAR